MITVVIVWWWFSISLIPSTFIIFIYLFVYLFIWLRQVLVAESSLQHAGSFIVERRLFVVARGLLSSCGAQALERAGSVVAEREGSVVAECEGSLVVARGL